MTTVIDISKLNKADVLCALYNASKPQCMSYFHYEPTPMASEIAGQILEIRTKFDYLKGRVMKVDLTGNEFDSWHYDRDNGHGAAERAIAGIQTL